MINVLVVYATDYQNTFKMAQAVVAGVQSVPDCKAVLKAAETATFDDLIAADAVVLGSPVHMGSAGTGGSRNLLTPAVAAPG